MAAACVVSVCKNAEGLLFYLPPIVDALLFLIFNFSFSRFYLLYLLPENYRLEPLVVRVIPKSPVKLVLRGITYKA